MHAFFHLFLSLSLSLCGSDGYQSRVTSSSTSDIDTVDDDQHVVILPNGAQSKRIIQRYLIIQNICKVLQMARKHQTHAAAPVNPVRLACRKIGINSQSARRYWSVRTRNWSSASMKQPALFFVSENTSTFCNKLIDDRSTRMSRQAALDAIVRKDFRADDAQRRCVPCLSRRRGNATATGVVHDVENVAAGMICVCSDHVRPH